MSAFITQSFVVGWNLSSQGVPSTCADAGAQSVYLDFVVPTNSMTISSPFNCTNGAGTSYAIPLYNTSAQWQLALVNSSGQDIPTAPVGGTIGVPSATDVHLGTQNLSF